MTKNLDELKIPKTLIFGTTGFIGKYLFNFYKSFFPDIPSFSRKNSNFDLENLIFPSNDFLKEIKPTYAIISAAISKINICEEDTKKAYKINVTGTLKLIEFLTKNDITPIWFSSDYVFDGNVGSYSEESLTNPITEYGKQKEILEKEIPKITKGNHLIIRPGRVYSLNLDDKTIFSEIFSHLIEEKAYRAAKDQFFSLTYIEDLIRGIVKLQTMNARGIFHICAKEKINRYQLALIIADKLSLSMKNLFSIKLDDLEETFKRPKNTSMQNAKFYKSTNLEIRDINTILDLKKKEIYTSAYE
ncbi:MAG: dTDP-4-dehydrorhamnose reductase [Candidatus Anoxychlamydiales bacterium]|nr:dTDP-4-dehydrorhamnose reductase [Candidatus Anoxychlamydiales bacterium]NGX35517.1 dTDP-4-dehydrorhamnose reductase [Candidatus Anoxychlamydiales bacterium]